MASLERLSPQPLVLLSRPGHGRLVDQYARTKRTRVRHTALVDLAVALQGTDTKIALAHNDVSQWSMSLWPPAELTARQDTTA